MKPEYIEEIEVDELTQIKHKAACVWRLLGAGYTQAELEKYCSLYGITTDQALEWKSYWI